MVMAFAVGFHGDGDLSGSIVRISGGFEHPGTGRRFVYLPRFLGSEERFSRRMDSTISMDGCRVTFRIASDCPHLYLILHLSNDGV
jgi:hypothetical protein